MTTKKDNRVKLSPEQKQEIKNLFKYGKKQVEIARLFNVSQVQVYWVLNPEKQAENAKNSNRTGEEYKERNRLRVEAFRKAQKTSIKKA